jgi:hypothetical protein
MACRVTAFTFYQHTRNLAHDFETLFLTQTGEELLFDYISFRAADFVRFILNVVYILCCF